MEKLQTDILSRLQLIFRDTLDDDALKITPETNQAHTRRWDSLAHVTLIMAIEREFDIYFTAKEAASLTSVATIIDIIEVKTTVN